MPGFFKDRKRSNLTAARFRSGPNYSNLEAPSCVGGMVVDEKDMVTVSKKKQSEAFFQKKKIGCDIRHMDFYVKIDLLDGIIVTNSGNRKNMVKDGLPIFAVVSYKKKIAGINKSFTTNIPSCKLESHPSSIGKNRERYYAMFNDETQDGSQTFKLSAPMRKKGSHFEPRLVEFQIGLMKGSQVIYLGNATLTLNGDEKGKRQSIPVGSKTKSKSGIKGNIKKDPPTRMISASFSDCPGCKYSLQRSMLRVSVSTDSNFNGVEHISVNITESLSYLSGLSFDMADSTGSLSSEEEVEFPPHLENRGNDTVSGDISHRYNFSGKNDKKIMYDSISENHSHKYTIPQASFEFDAISEGTGSISSSEQHHSNSTQASTSTRASSLLSSEEDDDSTFLEEVSIGTIKWKDEF